jgi:hypothetical protein
MMPNLDRGVILTHFVQIRHRVRARAAGRLESRAGVAHGGPLVTVPLLAVAARLLGSRTRGYGWAVGGSTEAR